MGRNSNPPREGVPFFVYMMMFALVAYLVVSWLAFRYATPANVPGDDGAEYDCTRADHHKIRAHVHECQATGRRDCVVDAADTYCTKL